MNMFRNLFLAAVVIVVAPVVANDGDTTSVVTPGRCARATAFVLRNFDAFAGKLRFPGAVAKYLASPSKDNSMGRVATFFDGKQLIVSRMVTLAAVTGVTYGAYKMYQSLTQQEDDENVDEYDFGIFADEDFDVTEEEVN